MKPLFPTIALVAWAVLGNPVWSQEPRSDAAQALTRLREGNERFASDHLAERDIGAARRAKLTKSQHPFAIVLACADSRVPPELIFDQGLGDLFVVRVAGNVADPAVVGSVEYAAQELHVPLIVVLGHESCGAVKAALGDAKPAGDLGELIQLVHPGAARGGPDALTAAVRANARYQADELRRRSAAIRELSGSGRVQIAVAVYSLSKGAVTWLDQPAATSNGRR